MYIRTLNNYLIRQIYQVSPRLISQLSEITLVYKIRGLRIQRGTGIFTDIIDF